MDRRIPPRAIAPMDNGCDASDLAQRLLVAAPQLLNICVDAQSSEGQTTWQASQPRTGEPPFDRSHLTDALDPAGVFAVSYCAGRSSSGVCLFDHSGAVVTLWSMKAKEFDAWLARTLPECGSLCRASAHA
jgi:hypothetical protein